MKKIVKISIIIISSLVVLFILFIAISVLTEYSPPHSTPLQYFSSGSCNKQAPSGSLTLFTWNIGYAGLDAKTDFILDGGTKSIAESKDRVQQNMSAIQNVLSGVDADLFLFQEIDRPSHRSYSIDEAEIITQSFPGYCNWFAKNFQVLFIPFPILDPIGQVQSGLVSLSRIDVDSSTRYSLPGEYSWPLKLFHLKRCMNVLRIPTGENDKDWVIINLHLSAYDSGGTLRSKQLEFIKEYITELYNQGHYVIAGGDWNSLFPGIDKTSFGPYSTDEKDLYWVQKIPPTWTPPGWQWAFDPTIPTCRSLEAPYEKGKNFTTVIDGFLVSPSLEIREVKGFNLGFRHSDHNPVQIRVVTRGT